MIRDVSRILREQLNEYVYFDVIAYGTAFASWSKRGVQLMMKMLSLAADF